MAFDSPTDRAPAHNRLVWLTDGGWQAVEARDWDDEARDLLTHWRAHRRSFVVGRQRPGVADDVLCLGLPAPARWGRRRIALEAPLMAVAAVGDFPKLAEVAVGGRAAKGGDDLSLATRLSGGVALAAALADLGAKARVYGSFGWQHMTGEACVRDGSDCDLRVEVPDLAIARSATRLLAAARLPCRIDGELAFPGGEAVAWREFAQGLDGTVPRVLVKSRQRLRLVDTAELAALERPGLEEVTA